MPIWPPPSSIPTYPTGVAESCITRHTRTGADARFSRTQREAQRQTTTNDRSDTDTSLLDDGHRVPDGSLGAQQERARGSPPPPHLSVLWARDPRPHVQFALTR